MTAPTVSVHTLEVPGACLHYEVRGAGPLMVLVGAPMDASAFAPLADLLAADHAVLTTDPRGINRSTLDHSDRDSTPEQRAEDLAQLITHLDAGPAIVFGSSGGAVSALALVQAHPDLVGTLIAHEPPLGELLDDREQVRARTEAMIATYLAGDVTGAWTQFFAQANIAVPDGVIEQMFGVDRDPDTMADERFWFAHELLPSVSWRPDLTALRGCSTRIVIGIGEESGDQHSERTSNALADALGLTPTRFPGDHTGFTEDVPAFAARLRAVLRDG